LQSIISNQSLSKIENAEYNKIQNNILQFRDQNEKINTDSNLLIETLKNSNSQRGSNVYGFIFLIIYALVYLFS
jgi:hypothetical protein